MRGSRIVLEAALAGADASAVRKLVPVADARRVCEEAYQKAKAAGDFALAVRTATVLGKVADAGANCRLLAEAEKLHQDSVEWAKAKLERGKKEVLLRREDDARPARGAEEGLPAPGLTARRGRAARPGVCRAARAFGRGQSSLPTGRCPGRRSRPCTMPRPRCRCRSPDRSRGL